MAKSGTETRRLIGQILVRLTEADRKALGNRAQDEQKTLASLAREMICAALGLERPKSKSRAVAPELILEMAALRMMIAKLTEALVQASIGARRDANPMEHEAIELLLPEIRSAVRLLDLLKKKLWKAL